MPSAATNPVGEAWRAEALQIQSEPGDMRGGFGSLAQQGLAYHTSAGMQEGAASPFLSHPQRQTPLGRLGGPKPSKCNPNPATCAAGSEILRSKVSLHVSPAAPQAQGKRVLAEKAGSAGLFRQAGAAASRFRYHVPAVRFAHRHMMFPSLQG